MLNVGERRKGSNVLKTPNIAIKNANENCSVSSTSHGIASKKPNVVTNAVPLTSDTQPESGPA